MAALSSKLRGFGADGYRGIAHWCPGCKEVHVITIASSSPRPVWTFDGNVEAPTTTPSVRLSDEKGTRCHYFLKAGRIEFCDDCRHTLSGKTVDLPAWPYVAGEYGGVED
jgi:Family of unknown function (DUF6527)